MRAETIERLSAKGHFSSEQALALAEAMDTVIEKAQLVTVPIASARANACSLEKCPFALSRSIVSARMTLNHPSLFPAQTLQQGEEQIIHPKTNEIEQ